MAWVGVFADEYPVAVNNSYAYALQIKVWADGVVIADYHIVKNGNLYYQNVTTPASASNSTIREPIARLPAVIAREWEVQVESHFPVREICLAQTMDEIKSA